MSSYKKLASNSFLFFLANFGSKILSFVMVPYYTYALTTAEYGTVDVLVSTVSLLAPLVTFGMGDIVTLYLVRKEYTEEKVFTNSFLTLLLGNIIIYILYPLVASIETLKAYVMFFFLLLLVQSFYSVLQSYARGIGKVVSFAVSGILYTAILVTLNLLFLTHFKMGIKGYLMSMIIAYFVCCLYLFAKIDVSRLLRFGAIDKQYTKGLLKLSLPLLPTAILWWLMNVCDKYTILFYLSASANGLYTVAHKLPTILSTIYSVFQQAWQLTTMEMKTKEERSEMYSNLFEILSCLLVIATAGLIMCAKFFVVTFCETTYESAWLIIPMLLFSAIFNSLSGFFGSNYIPMGNTVAVLKISVIGTILNCVLNIVLVPLFGLQGAAFATCAGFIYMTIHKMIGTRKFTPLHVDLRRFIVAMVILAVQSVLTINLNSCIIYPLGVVVLIVLLVMYRNIVRIVWNKVVGIIRLKIAK